MLDVQLVAMPFAAVERPSLALGVLKGSLVSHGLSCEVEYANITFAEEISLKSYFFFSNSLQMAQMGEWVFSGWAFPGFSPEHQKYLDQFAPIFPTGGTFLWDIRNMVDGFIDRIARRILAKKPRIVGCSSMFQQHCASLALLRRIKSLRPEITTMLGGANCEGSMGVVTHQNCSWVDYVVSGEADQLMPGLCRSILQQSIAVDLPEGVYGPCHRDDGASPTVSSRAVVTNLNDVPIPAYDDYFEALNTSSIAGSIKPGLPFETSRGCWWGQKQQCIFCGVNGSRIAHRAKSPERIVDELDILHKRHGIDKFVAADSMLGMDYFKTVLPKLIDGENSYKIMFETLAALTKEQICKLGDAGVRWIQPGMESLHDDILKMLRKGTTSWNNIQLLKWCMQHGIFVSWVFLAGIPGESLQWYKEMASWLPLIRHLHPPLTILPIHYDRFSPFHREPETFGLKLRPLWIYKYVYPFSDEQMEDFAYYFQDFGVNRENNLNHHKEGHDQLAGLIKVWYEDFYAPRDDMVRMEVSPERPMLNMEVDGESLVITDTRPCAVQKHHRFVGMSRTVYEVCDAAKTREMLIREMERRCGQKSQWADLEPVVDELLKSKLMLKLKDRYLSLAVEMPYPKMLTHDDYPGGLVVIPRARKQAAILPIAP